ncbi:MAG: M1 family metallopeptidase [Polyangiaceae bacterium]|nr:M1 family metallopeptidase [Polyangiaceae bacterium]
MSAAGQRRPRRDPAPCRAAWRVGAALLGLAAAATSPASRADSPNRSPAATAIQAPGPRYDDDASLREHAAAVASYDLAVRLDPVVHDLRGAGTIRWTNASDLPAGEIFVQLYLNAFKNDRTLFQRSPFARGRSGRHAAEWGWIDVTRLVAPALGGADLWRGADLHPGGDLEDETLVRVPLPRPVAPGEAITLEFEWTARLPRVVERTGHAGSFHLVAQWFPKLARREPDGRWSGAPFHPHAEFHADFGDYDVALDVPAQFRVGATGSPVDERVEGGRRLARYSARDVHDFAWAAWDSFVERAESIDGVAVRVLHPPGHHANAERTLAALRHALPWLSHRFGRYPYPALTVVHPPAAAADAGGMEYPTLVTTGGPWWLPAGARWVEAVTVHELAHQWFQGLVATDERRWPFLDEGLTTWVEQRALGDRFGEASLLELGGLAVSDTAARRVFAIRHGLTDPIALPASGFVDFASLGGLAYARTATVLETLARVYGERELFRALGRYARRHRFEHPDPRHLVAAVRESAGDAAAEALEAALFDRGWVDYQLARLDVAPEVAPGGTFDGAEGRVVRERGQPTNRWVGRVVVRRLGTLRLPVEIELRTADGGRERRAWDGATTSTVLEWTGSSPLVSAHVDPDHRVLLDQDLVNNLRRAGPASTPRVRERATLVAALLLALLEP